MGTDAACGSTNPLTCWCWSKVNYLLAFFVCSNLCQLQSWEMPDSFFFLEGASLLRYPILASGSKVKRNHVLLVLAKADLRPWSDRGLVVLSPRALLDTFRHRMGLVDSPFCSKRFSFSFLVPEVREVLLIKDCKSTTGHGQACRAFSR